MTNAQKKVNDAREAFQKEMDVWGLTVEHGSSCHYVVGAKAVTFSTAARPAKGRKKLIEDLRAAGYEVWTFKVEDKDGKRYMKFRAYKTVKIKTAADDAEEYVEQPTEVKQKNDDVNEIYRKNEFAVQVVAKGLCSTAKAAPTVGTDSFPLFPGVYGRFYRNPQTALGETSIAILPRQCYNNSDSISEKQHGFCLCFVQ